ncbi:DUF4190 domain-containing protein [Streptomyces tagetis]|uniref:DUF4190 domain-containing protein n=1 Tax=Streptomyces tagetis TaxID=2820809 RepID=UPI0027DAB835|nr:DUF4190 domain-containing protein [Streptomyces sp. RG38]
MSIPPPPGPQGPPPHGSYPEEPQGPAPHGPYPPGPQGPAPYGAHPQGPYGPQPYPAWGHPYGAPFAPPPPYNGLAIASFVLGLLCFVPVVGLVLGIVALVQIKRKGERGKGFAVAGTVLSGIGVALWTVWLALGVAGDFWEGFREGATGEGTAFALSVGQCFTTPEGSLEGFTYEVDEVPCGEQHEGEVFAAFDMPGGSYPGDDAITDVADERCYAASTGYAMDAWAVPEDVDVYYLTPTRASWLMGDREVTCVFGSVDLGGTLTGSVRADETTLDEHQLVYLEAAALVDRALEEMPEAAESGDDLPGYQEWAGGVAGALAEQSRVLREHTWPEKAARPVAELADALDSARREWERAASATDQDTYDEHMYEAYVFMDDEKQVTPRKALGLADTPPEYEDYDEEEDEGADGAGIEV